MSHPLPDHGRYRRRDRRLRLTATLIDGAAVVTLDADRRVIEPGWVLVDGAEIVEVGEGYAPPAARRSAAKVIEAAGAALIPGLINAHTHLFQTLFRGRADDKPLFDWLRDCIWPVASEMTAADVEAAATLGLVENLRSGATAVIDHQYVHSDPGIDQAVAAAADRLGVRLLLARGWTDRNYHPPLQETPAEVISRTKTLYAKWQDHQRVGVEWGPLIPWGCSDETIRSTMAALPGAGLHIHCAETEAEVAISLAERGVRHVPWLDSLEALGPLTQLAHSIWLDDAELDLIARRGAVVVHCPVSNMYLAAGVARIPEMISRGIPIALGSDGPGSNNRQDLFEVLKTTVLLQKVHRLEAMVLQPEEVLEMACHGGAAALGMTARLGVIEAGRLADLVLVELDSPMVAPVHRVVSALVFNCTPADVRTVMVDGRVVISDRRLLTADQETVVARAIETCRDLFQRSGVQPIG